MKLKAQVKSWLSKAKHKIDQHAPYSYIGLGILAGLIIFGAVIGVRSTRFSANDRNEISNNAEEQQAVDTRVESALTGIKVERELAERPVIGVMISNSTDARPQSDLSKAGVVFEAVAEGGITRYLAMYLEQDSDFLGPVRSLRPYYIDFSRAFDASVGHVGGSQEALDAADTELEGRDIDQFQYGSRAFERVGFRFAPHNVYTELSKLRAIAEQNGHTESSFTPLARKDGDPAATPTTTDIEVDFSTASYNTSWSYNKESNKYMRNIGGNKHIDRETNKQLAFDSVVVIKAQYGNFFRDGTTYNTIKSTGSGTAYIFQDGKAQRVTWERPNATSQFTFENEEGEEVNLNRGQAWFAMQPSNQRLNFE